MATTSSLMTTEELLALRDDGIDRELINGALREYPRTTHGLSHGNVTQDLTAEPHLSGLRIPVAEIFEI